MDDPSKQLAHARFVTALDTDFTVTVNGSTQPPFQMRLIEINTRRSPPGYEQFSAIFIGPPSPIMAQGMYRLVNEKLGELDLFMAPVGRGSTGIEYEICISRDTRGDPQAGGAES
jgi:hypothetical protein